MDPVPFNAHCWLTEWGAGGACIAAAAQQALWSTAVPQLGCGCGCGPHLSGSELILAHSCSRAGKQGGRRRVRRRGQRLGSRTEKKT